jgi:hypothetical protein
MTDAEFELDDAEDISELFSAIMKGTRTIVGLGLKKASPSAADALFVAIGGIIGALKMAGTVIVPADDMRERVKKGDDNFRAMQEEVDNRVTDDVMLYVALLAVTVVSDIGDGEHLKADFGPPAFKTAMDKFKKLTGRDITGLKEAFVEAAKNYGDLPYPTNYGRHDPKPH